MLCVVEKMFKNLPLYKTAILVVDDRSPDGTQTIVRKFQKENSNVFLLSGPKDGLGKAISRGIKYAISKLHADIVVTNEADFSYSPLRVPTMIRLIENGSDAVFGSRRLITPEMWPLSRRIVHFVANTFFAKYIAGITQVDDHNSAFKAIKVGGCLDKVDFTNFPKGYAFFNYFTFQISKITPNMSELKTSFHPRTAGESKISFKLKYLKNFLLETFEYIFVCLRIRFEKTFI
jgi:dolichol-phosphate mannosyltransferase